MREIESTVLSLDQFEALRLCDVERLDQEEAGRRMGVSRGTIQRLLYTGRKALVAAILGQNAILVNLQEGDGSDADLLAYQRKRRKTRHVV
jgi:predicted DNA-binding protein (UPF0251 family)